MGLLNHLFGSKKDIAKELAMDDDERIALWDEHLTNHALRIGLAKQFGFDNIDNALQDFKTIKRTLKRIGDLISPDLVNISKEIKTDKEILKDLEQLKSNPEIGELFNTVVSAEQKQSTLLKIFHEILNVLKVELHLIRLIRKNPENVKDLLLKLFKIIILQEDNLYKVFRENRFHEELKHIPTEVMRIARAIMLEKEVKEERETDEEKLTRELTEQMAEQMGPGETRSRYRELAEDIFDKLVEMTDAPFRRTKDGEEVMEGIKSMERFMKDDEIMYEIVKKLRPKYDDAKIKIVILAFRKAYNLGDFGDLDEFTT